MMTSNIEITNEQINDVPLLLGIMLDMGIQEMLDSHIKIHGGWEGISVGTLVVIWLSYMLTEQDHRMVRQWVATRQQMFEKLLGIELCETDCSDDRLAQVLRLLGKEGTQQRLDEGLTRNWMQAYALPTRTVRFDTTSDQCQRLPFFYFARMMSHHSNSQTLRLPLLTWCYTGVN